MKDDFGGVAVETTDEFGGVPLTAAADEFGGVPVQEAAPARQEQPSDIPRSSLDKAGYALIAGAGRTIADFASTEIGPARSSFRRHTQASLRANMPGAEGGYDAAMTALLREREAVREHFLHPEIEGEAAAAQQLAEATPGNATLAKVAEFTGGALPFLASGPAAPLVAAKSTAGAVYKEAYARLREQGLSDEEAVKLATDYSISAGVPSGVLFAGQGLAQRPLSALLTRAAARPITQAAGRTAASGISAGIVMAGDSAQRETQAGQTYHPELTPGQILEDAAWSGAGGVIAGTAMHGATELPGMIPARRTAPKAVTPATAQKIFSEFGGEAETPATAAVPSSEVAAAPPDGTIPVGESPAVQAEAAPPQTTVRESPTTLHGQIVKLHEGRTGAVLFTPEDTVPDWAVKDARFEVTDTKDGKILYDTAAWTRDQIQTLVDAGETGTVLGYGTPRKPVPGTETGAVVVRDKQGMELRAVVVDAQSAPAVLQAAQKYAGPEDVVRFEDPREVIAKRLDATAATAERTPREVNAEEQGKAYAAERAQREAAAREISARRAAERARAGTGTPDPKTPPATPAVKVTERHLDEARAALETERAPDVLDDLEGNVTSGMVQFPADMADAIDAARERSARALHQKDWKTLSTEQRRKITRQLRASTTEGTAADVARQGLGDKYADLSANDFLETLLDAGEQRLATRRKGASAAVKQLAEEIARAEAGKTELTDEQIAEMERAPVNDTGDAVEKWFDDAISKVEFGTDWTGSTSMGLAKLPVWLSQEAATIALRAAKLAYTTGRDLATAIREGIAALRGLNPSGFNEAEATQWLADTLRERATGQRIQGSAAFSEEVKRQMTDLLYERRPQETDMETAAKMVDRIGEANAIELVESAPEWLPGALRVILGAEVVKRLNAAEVTARQENNLIELDEVQSQGARLASVLTKQATNPAQTLAAYNILAKLSPDMQVLRAKREVESAGAAEIDRHRDETDAMRHALDEGRATGIEAVRTDAKVNTAARAAVDDVVKNSEETTNAIIMELAEPWAQSDYIVNHAREAVRAKANELLNKQPRPPGLTPAAHLARILDDLAGRAASIFAGHIQGSEPGVLLVDKLSQRLGLDKAHASKLASQLSKEWDKQLASARAKLDGRLAAARVRQERREREPESNSAVDRSLRKQLREMNLKLGDAIRQAASDRQRTGEHLADKIVQASGLTGDAATALRNKLAARYDALTSAAQRSALEGLEKRAGIKVSRTMRGAFERLIELDRLSPVNGDTFFKTVRTVLKLPELTEAQAKELRQLVLDAQSAPAGWQQQRLMAKALTLTETAKGAIGWRDVPFSIWYANIFSAPPTHLANLIGNTIKAVEVVGLQSLLHPANAPHMLRAFARGVESGGLEAASVMLTGQLEGTRLLKAEAARPLEMRIAKGGFNKVLLPWAAVGRALAAEDVLFFKGHEEIKWQMLARRIAKQEGLRGEQLDARVQDLLHNTRAAYDAAKVQAASEGLSGLDATRRAHEIIEQSRERDMPGSTDIARQFGLEHTFNSEPYGVMGAVSDVLNNMNNKLVVTRFAVPVVRIVANLANESLNYFPPVGLARVAVPKFRSDIVQRAGGDVESLHLAYARAAVGTILFAGLAATVANSVNDPDPTIAITGTGPRTKAQRDQLRDTGWKPNSIKIGGRYYSYQESHLNIPLALLGNYSDALRYKGLDEQDALNRFAYSAQMTLNTIFSQRMLSGVNDLMETMKPDGDGKQLANLLTRSASSFVVPNAARWVDQVFDPTVYEPDDVKAALYAQTPFARRLNRPALNALGETVERSAMDRFTSPVKPDPLMVLMASKNAWIPMPPLDAQTVGNPKLGKDYLRPMTPDEYYNWIATSGPEIRRRLTEDLDKLAGMPQDEAQAYVRKIAAQERAKAKPGE